MKSLLGFLFVLVNLLQVSVAERDECTSSPKYEIQFINNLPPSSSLFQFYCRSGNMFFAAGSIIYANKKLNWKFCDSSPTLYSCVFWWDTKSVLFNVQNNDISQRCINKVCYWAAKGDGIYFTTHPFVQAKLEYYWNGTHVG